MTTSAPNVGSNVDHEEIAKFDALASRWWDPEGDFRPLHDINPVRLDYVRRCAGGSLAGLRVLDIGCGGGLLAEAMAAAGATVTGIDMGAAPLQVARLHALESGTSLDYQQITAEAMAAAAPASFDLVTCLEMLEHVPDPASVVQACATLVRPGGTLVFSTINKNPKAWALAVLGAEYVLGLLPRGTHDYQKFIRPSQLASHVRQAGLLLQEVRGLSYNPFTRSAGINSDVDVNYLVHAQRPEAPVATTDTDTNPGEASTHG